MTPGPHGRWFATRFAPLLVIIGIAAGLYMADTLDGQPVAPDFWKQLLAIAGLSVLPLVVLAMRAPAFATTKWRVWSTALVAGSFVVVLLVVGICLHEIARVVPEGQSPPSADSTRLRVACGATGAILAAIACGVVMEFFKESKTMEPSPEPESGSSGSRKS